MSGPSSSTPRDEQPFDLETAPFDEPPWGLHDWGGDGTDLRRPVRAHVLAALRPTTAPYPRPVDALRHLGDVGNFGTVLKRYWLGLRQKHLPHLLRMARDRALYTADSNTDEVWAPLHALYALRDLDVSAVVPELIPLLDLADDRLSTELPELLGQVGAPALEPLRDYLADHTRWAFGHMVACSALEQIARQHPELSGQVVAALSNVLWHAEDYHEVANTGAMDALVELGAVEALPLIRHAFELGRIDETMRGAWGDILRDLRIKPEAGDPLLAESQRRFEERQDRFMPREMRERLQKAFERLGSRGAATTHAPREQHEPHRTEQQDTVAPLMSRDALESPGTATTSAPQALHDPSRTGQADAFAPLVNTDALESSRVQPISVPQASRDPGKSAEAKARKQKNKRKMESVSRKANRRKRR